MLVAWRLEPKNAWRIGGMSVFAGGGVLVWLALAEVSAAQAASEGAPTWFWHSLLFRVANLIEFPAAQSLLIGVAILTIASLRTVLGRGADR